MTLLRSLLVCLALALTAAPPALAEGAQAYQKITDEVLQLLVANKPKEAVDRFFSDYPLKEKITDKIVVMKAQLSQFEAQIGLPTKHVKLAEEIVGDVFAHQFYVIVYERQPMSVTFQYFKPKDEWAPYGFTLDADFDDLIGNLVARNLLEAGAGE